MAGVITPLKNQNDPAVLLTELIDVALAFGVFDEPCGHDDLWQRCAAWGRYDPDTGEKL